MVFLQKIFCLFLFFIPHTLYLIPSFSQSYNFKNYSVEQGLPFVQVYAIFQDSKGNLWTGGYGGLSKFDGKTFTNYAPKNGLANHWVTSITEDKEGNIWAGTISGVTKIDGENLSTFTKRQGLAGNYVNSLTTDKNGNLWIATTEGITIYDGKTFTSFTTKNKLASNNISVIYTDKNGNIWLGTDKGVSKILSPRKILQDDLFDESSVINGIYNSPVTSITGDDNNNIYFGTNNGLVKYDGINFITYTEKDGLCDNKIHSVIKDTRTNAVWIATPSGLNKFYDGKIETYRVNEGSNSDLIRQLYMDYENNLWLGTHNGLYRFRDKSFATFNEKDGLNNTMIFPVFRDNKNNLWVGTEGDGFYLYDGKSFLNFSKKEKLPGTRANAAMQDRDGIIWLGTDKGLTRYEGKSIINYLGKKDGLKSDSVTAIIQDRQGNIWLGGNKGGAIWNGKKFARFELKDTSNNFDVWCLFEDSKGNIWLGTYNGGLFKYDGKKYEEYSRKLNLKSKTYLAIQEDKDGNLYFGSFDGIYIYSPATGKVSQITEKNGLSSDLIYLLLFDNEYKHLYIGSNQGMNKFDAEEYKKSGKIILDHYGKEEGFSGVETNSNGIWQDKDGTVWFATVDGLVRYDPNVYNFNRTESKTSIRRIRIFYNDTLLPQNAGFPYYLNNISFEYIGISLTGPSKVRYKFILEGFDKVWSPETKETFARYSNLPAGQYVFKVISCNNEGLWNKKPATFSFQILPPVWKTWWFRTVMAIAAIIFVLISFNVHAKNVRKKEVQRLSSEIQQANTELKALRAQINPHFIFNSLTSIQSFIMSRDEELALRYLNKFAKLMRRILSGSEKTLVTLREELDTLKLYLELESLRWENKFDYTIFIDPKVETDFQKIPGMLIQPYLENAIIHGVVPKYASILPENASHKDNKGKIEIRISQTDTHIICTIEDNGIGRKKSQQLKMESNQQMHKAMGMKITSERLEVLNRIHNSNLNVLVSDLEDENGNATGTKVEIFIPIY